MATELKDVRSLPDPIYPYTSSILRQHIPLVIDNGSYQCRAGWATSAEPMLNFKNLIAKPRKERGKKDADPPATPPIQVGNDITNIEAVRFQLKTQFDRNVVTHFEAQEQVFDYIFGHLGINTNGGVHHPIVMTESLVNPNYCRHLMSELLFECYGVPSVTYGIDGVLAFHRNRVGNTGIVVDCGYHTVHIIPVVDGNIINSQTRRINIGGYQMVTYLHRLLQLKYPAHLNAISPSRVEELLHNHCQIALHYQEEIKKWTDPNFYDSNVRKIQLPYVQPVVNPGLSTEAQKERKREMARRLIEINARKREEKLSENEEQLNQFFALQDLLDEGETDEFYRAIRSFGIKDEDDLARQINRLNTQIEKIKQKIAAAAATSGDNESNQTMDEKIVLSNTSKIQPPNDPMLFEAWLNEFRKKRADITETRLLRKQRRLDMAKRRTAAAQERMRIISQLAKKEKANDDFGMRDEDWDVYKTISKEGNDSDSDAENEKLMEIDEILREYDPQYCGPIGNDTSEMGVSEAHQLHLAIEQLRAPELLFQPFMIGNIEAGIAETLEYVLKQFDAETQLRLANNVFVTGGCANFSGLEERLSRELLEMRPFQTPHRINMAKNPSLDAWFGARELANDDRLPEYWISRQEYNEKGGEYLKEHYASNKYYQTPIAFTSGLVSDTVVKEEPADI